MSQIQLDLDLAYLSYIRGDGRSIIDGAAEDYVTVIDFATPIPTDSDCLGKYLVEYEGYRVTVHLVLAEDREDDLLYELGFGISCGPPTVGMPELSYEDISDNRGKYPCVLAQLVFPYRLANWHSLSPTTKEMLVIDHEEARIAGHPKSKDKIEALKVLNRLIQKNEVSLISGASLIKYDEVTVYSERYFRPDSKLTLLTKINILASETAFRNAAEDRFLKGIHKDEIREEVLRFQSEAMPEISDEGSLHNVVLNVLETVLGRYVERQRCIDAFWDGKRPVIVDGKKIHVPKSPKRESEIQTTLFMLLDLMLERFGVHVVRERHVGPGELDFTCLFTTPNKARLAIGIEFKLGHHTRLGHGISRQLPAYLEAIESKRGIFLVLWFKDKQGKVFKLPKNRTFDEMFSWVKNKCTESSKENKLEITPSFIDASVRPSASQL